MILFGSLLVGIETYPEILERHGKLLRRLDQLVLLFFAFEIFIKLAARGRRVWLYFYDPWNAFDFFIVASCFLALHFEMLQAVLLFRILRVLRLITVIPRMQVLVGALVKSIPSIGYVSLLLLVQFYVYAVIGTIVFGKNDPVHFGTLAIAMLSLFRVVTLEDWTDIMYIQMYGSDRYGYQEFPEVQTEPTQMPLFAAAYFVSFVLVGTMIVLNLFVGVILNGIQELQSKADIDRIVKQRKVGQITLTDEMKLISKQIAELQDSIEAVQRRVKSTADPYRGLRLRKVRGKQLRVVRGGNR